MRTPTYHQAVHEVLFIVREAMKLEGAPEEVNIARGTAVRMNTVIGEGNGFDLDELDRLSIAMEIEVKFDVHVPDDVWQSFATPLGIIDWLVAKEFVRPAVSPCKVTVAPLPGEGQDTAKDGDE